MNESEIIEIVMSTLEEKPSKIEMNESLRNLGWDSLADLIFIGTIDEKYSLALDADVLSKCETSRDLLNLVSDALTKLD